MLGLKICWLGLRCWGCQFWICGGEDISKSWIFIHLKYVYFPPLFEILYRFMFVDTAPFLSGAATMQTPSVLTLDYLRSTILRFLQKGHFIQSPQLQPPSPQPLRHPLQLKSILAFKLLTKITSKGGKHPQCNLIQSETNTNAGEHRQKGVSPDRL